MIHRYSKKNLLLLCTLLLLAIYSSFSSTCHHIFFLDKLPEELPLDQQLIFSIKAGNKKKVNALFEIEKARHVRLTRKHPLIYATSIEMAKFILDHKSVDKPLPTVSQLIANAIEKEYAAASDLISLYKKRFPTQRIQSTGSTNPLALLVVSSHTNKAELAQCILKNIGQEETRKLITVKTHFNNKSILELIKEQIEYKGEWATKKEITDLNDLSKCLQEKAGIDHTESQ